MDKDMTHGLSLERKKERYQMYTDGKDISGRGTAAAKR